MFRSNIQRRMFVVSALVISLVGLSGCAAGSTAKPADVGGSVAGKKVFIVSCINSVPFCAKENQLYKSELEAAGAKVTMLLDAFSGPDEASNIQQAISQGADLIGYVGNVQAPARAALVQAKAAGIPVVILGTLPEPAIDGLYTTYVGPNEAQSGVTVANALEAQFKMLNVTDQKVALITGTQASLVVQTRNASFDKTIKLTRGLTVVDVQDANWDPSAASTIAQQLFAKYPNGIGAIWAHSGAMAAGVVKAAQQAGLTAGSKAGNLLVIGTNCDPTSIQAIKAGTLFATTSQGPATDAKAQVAAMLSILKGEKVPKNIETENKLITLANVADFEAQCNY